MPDNRSPDSKMPAADPANPTQGGAKTAQTIRDMLRDKGDRSPSAARADRYGSGQKPPTPPHGTRRSMGKR